MVFLEAEIVGNSISKVRVEQKPKGLSEKLQDYIPKIIQMELVL